MIIIFPIDLWVIDLFLLLTYKWFQPNSWTMHIISISKYILWWSPFHRFLIQRFWFFLNIQNLRSIISSISKYILWWSLFHRFLIQRFWFFLNIQNLRIRKKILNFVPKKKCTQKLWTMSLQHIHVPKRQQLVAYLRSMRLSANLEAIGVLN